MRQTWVKEPVADERGRGELLFKRASVVQPPPPVPTFTRPPAAPAASESPVSRGTVPVAAAAPAAPAPAAGGGGSALSLEDWISEHKMDKYKDALLDLAGCVDDLKEFTDDDVDEFASEQGIPKLPLRRFKKALAELGATVSTD